jgi:hypothetical protein
MEAVAVLFVLIGVAVILATTLTANTTTTPDPLMTAMAVNTDLIDFSSAAIAVIFGSKGIEVPTNFQTAPDTFTIPKTGNYRISSNILVTEQSGIATQVVYYAQVNGATNYVVGFDSIRDNGSGTLGGDVVVTLKAGDTVKMIVGQFFGVSTQIGYSGVAATPTETFNLTNVSFQYIKV